MTAIYHLIISRPLYNGLIFLINLFPFFDMGVIVIIFTVIIKVILLPLSLKASRSQIEMRDVQKDLDDIKKKYKDDKEEQSKQTIQYYKDKGINPFAGIFVLLIQIPIIIGLYRVFLNSGLPAIQSALLYSFVHAPAMVNMIFLGLTNVGHKSIVLALIAGLSTYFQLDLASKGSQSVGTGVGTQQDIARMMTKQMKYFFPIIVIFISYSISGALALYWVTNNIFAIAQEMYIKKKYHKTPPVVV